MTTNDTMTSNANGIAPIVMLAAAYDAYIDDPDNDGDDTGFFASGANKATITSPDFSRTYPVSLGSDKNEVALTGSADGMVTTRGELDEVVAVAGAMTGGQASNGYANLYSGDGQYILAVTVEPTAQAGN